MERYLIAPTSIFGQILFIKLLGLSFFFAFRSLSQQVLGLYGSRGITPIGDILETIKSHIKQPRYFYVPTIFWRNHSDEWLKWGTSVGMVLSVLVILNVLPAFLLLALTLLYLSYTTVGSDFLSFQWDVLLIETGFIGVLFAIQSPPPILVVYLAYFMLFRLLFASGVVKLLSGCPEWRSLEAMKYHYETQPLPNRGGFFAHHYFRKYSKFSTLSVFFLELITPFLIFGGPFLRLLAFGFTLFLQLLIMATGNYAFFNLLTIGLSFTLLDDKYLSWMHGALSLQALPVIAPVNLVLNLIAAIFIFVNALMLLRLFYHLKVLDDILKWFQHFQLVNSYGLFAVMTTKRNEILLEGSNDGVLWKEYELKWKPDRLETPPLQIAPLQPRLDWQMWFASLSHYKNNPWFYQLIARMLQGSPDVIALFKNNPFPEGPPKMIRAQFYQYHFNDLKDHKTTGNWWKRRYIGLYAPPFSLKDEES